MNDNIDSQRIGSRITRHGTILAISGIVCKLLLLVYTVLAVEILGREQFGRIEYFIEMGIIFTVLIDFGMEQTVTRELARRREQLHKSLYPLVTFRMAASVFGGGLMALFLWLGAKEGHTWALILSALTYYFVVLHTMLIRAVVRSVELLHYEGIANLLDKVVHIALALVFLLLLPRLPFIVLCYAAGALVSLVIYWAVILKHYGIQRQDYTYKDWYDWQRLALPIGLSSACILLLHREDTAMVNWIQGDAETGVYRAPYRFLEGLFLFPQVLAISAYPVFSKLYHETRPFTDSAALLLRGLIMMSLPMAVGGHIIAHHLIEQLTPEVSPRGGFVFQILVWSLPFIYGNFLLGTILNATDRQKLNLKASALGLVGNFVLNIPAIYYYGAIGASVVTILSQGLYCLIMIYYTREFKLFTDPLRYGAIITACALMAAVLLWLQLQWYLAVLVGIAVYGIALIGLGGLSRRDFNSLVNVIKR